MFSILYVSSAVAYVVLWLLHYRRGITFKQTALVLVLATIPVINTILACGVVWEMSKGDKAPPLP